MPMAPMGMAADLSLGRNVPNMAQTFSMLRAGAKLENPDKFQSYLSALESYLKALEDERQKIEAFKRELPFCMQLLDDAIEASKQQLADRLASASGSCLQLTCNPNSDPKLPVSRHVLEESTLSKRKREKQDEEDERKSQEAKCGERWIESPGHVTQVKQGLEWHLNSETLHRKQEEVLPNTSIRQCQIVKPELEQNSGSVTAVLTNSKEKIKGAFVPFGREEQTLSKDNFNCVETSLRRETGQASRSSKETLGMDTSLKSRPSEVIQSQKEAAPMSGAVRNSSGQPQRKARRCWSPELHQRFLNALQQLGGSQVATPKQIRELMNVEGLTNDEVKSHLQKFRLHMRRPGPASQAEAQQGPHLVVFGGIWVPPEYGSQSAVPSQQALGLCDTPSQKSNLIPPPLLPQEFFSQLNSSSPLNFHNSAYSDHKQAKLVCQNLMPDPPRSRYLSLQDPDGVASSEEEGGSVSTSLNEDRQGEEEEKLETHLEHCTEGLRKQQQRTVEASLGSEIKQRARVTNEDSRLHDLCKQRSKHFSAPVISQDLNCRFDPATSKPRHGAMDLQTFLGAPLHLSCGNSVQPETGREQISEDEDEADAEKANGLQRFQELQENLENISHRNNGRVSASKMQQEHEKAGIKRTGDTDLSIGCSIADEGTARQGL